MKIDTAVSPADLLPAIRRMWEGRPPKSFRSTGPSTARRARRCTPSRAATSRAAGPTGPGVRVWQRRAAVRRDRRQTFLDMAIDRISAEMPAHITHFGVHDHGFNQICTYGNLRRLMGEGRIPHDPWQMEYFDLALNAPAPCRRIARPNSARASAISSRSTGRIRCSSTPCVRCGCWAVPPARPRDERRG